MSALTEIKQFMIDCCDFQGKVVLGGSRAIGEAGPASDTDYYLIAPSWRGLFKILKKKEKIRDFLDRHFRGTTFFLCTEWMVRYGWVYVYGRDEAGVVVSSKIDAKFLRNNALKVACQELARAERTDGDVRKSYHISKALLYALWSIVLSKEKRQCIVPPLFSIKAVLAFLPSLGVDFQRAGRIIKCKIQPVQLPQEDVEYARSVVERAVELFFKSSFSFRSYVIYNVFAWRRGSFRYLFINPDKKIVTDWQKYFSHPSSAEFGRLQRTTCQVLIV